MFSKMVENRQENMDLLFFDTFSHDNAEELNLDLVQFPRPVVIGEVRIIPLNTRVEAGVPGGIRLGATNPSRFKLELFVNNLSKPNASTFEKLGLLDYKANEDIQLGTDVQIPTDGLILRGWYTTLTIAIYGVLTNVTVEPEALPPPPPPQPRKQGVPVPPSSVKTEIKAESKDWEPPPQPLHVTPHTTQHPLDYIQEQLNQASLHATTLTVVSSVQQPQPIAVVTHGHPQTPGQIPIGIPPSMQEFSHPDHPDYWGYQEPDRRAREYPQSREGSRDRDRDYRGDYHDDWDHKRDHDRGGRDHGDYDRDGKDRSRGYDDRRERNFDRDRDRDGDMNRQYDMMDRDRGRDYDRGKDGFRDQDRGRGVDDMDKTHEWDGDRPREETVIIGRDIRDRGFRDRTREDFREKEKAREIYMETPRSPSTGSRSRSYSGDRFSSRSRTPSPSRPSPGPISPVIRGRIGETTTQEGYRLKDLVPVETASSQFSDMEQGRPPPVQKGDVEGEVMDEVVDQVGSSAEQMYMSDGDYESISSDDELIDIDTELKFSYSVSHSARRRAVMDYDMDEEAFSYITTPFNPYQFEMLPPTAFKDVSKTSFEVERDSFMAAEFEKPARRPKEAQLLLDIVEKYQIAPHHGRWVEAMESVPGLLATGLSYLIFVEDNARALTCLLDWAQEGLMEDRAMAQPEAAYKVRHLKMGFKLAGALCSCDPSIAVQCLTRDFQGRLLDNFESQYMSFSLKQQIVVALDQSTRFQDGLDWFLGNHKLQLEMKQEPDNQSLTNYQRTVLLLLQKKQVVRVTVAITTLIRKVHAYEVMNKLPQHLECVFEGMPLPPNEQLAGAPDHVTSGLHLNEADLDAVAACLDDITKVYTLAPTLIAQPDRTLPGKKMVEVKPSHDDPYPTFYHLANACRLLESLCVVTSSPAMSCVPTVFGAARSLLLRMIGSQHGLAYLASRSEVTNKIVQALMQITDSEEISDENVAQQLGIELIYHLQTLHLVDRLRAYHRLPEKNLTEDQMPVGILHMLFTMTFTPIGHSAVVQTLAYEDNVTCLLPFVKMSGKDLRRSVCAGYTSELLNIVVHYSDSVEFLKKHGEELLAFGEQGEFSNKLSRLKEWLLPLKAIRQFSHEGLSAIVEQLMAYKDDILKLPRGLITVLRVLRHLCIAPTEDFPEDRPEEMKYKCVLVDLYSADCLPVFVTILQKLSELMLRPWQKGLPKSSETFSLYIYIIKPCMEIVKAITQYLIMARGTEFRDLTALPTLFELHTVLCSVPTSSVFSLEINTIQRDIIDTIAAYTQPLSQPNADKDKISESLWTLAVRDLLKFTMKSPYTYLSGLQILSELLPLPLPLQTKEPLTQSEEQLAINTRKLWSAHLLPLHTALHGIIRSLAITACQPLQQILRKICLQMSDLAAPTATMITQCALDLLLEHIEAVETRAREAPDSDELKLAMATRGRFLNLLSNLISQPAIKCTMLRIIGPGGEEKYQTVLHKMLEILNLVSERPDHVQDQESIVSILQSLCDMEVTLTSGETTLSVQEQVCNALPTIDQLTLIIESLFEHIYHPNHKYDSVLPCIRAFVMLTEHDYSFYLLKTTFEKQKHKLAVYRLLNRIKCKFSKDSSDCLSTFSTTLEFLRLLVCIDMPETRSIVLTNQELRDAVAWTHDINSHPLVDLQKHLEEGVKEEETLDTLLESVNSLLSVLQKTSPVKQKPETEQPFLPEPQPLHMLFNMRSVCTITDSKDDRLTATFWQTTFEADDVATERDIVPCDLDAMCLKYCKDFSLEEELKKDIGLASEEELTKPKKLKDRRKSQEFVMWRGRGIRRPYMAPMRGRGIARGLAAQANRHDNFRNRPPNTSRPPSMHVDDFMKLEQKSEQTRPDLVVVDRQPHDSEFVRGRGGFDRGRGSFDRGRGHFFTPPATFRRDVSTRGGREGDMYRPKPPFENPRFGESHDRQMSDDRRDVHGGLGGRFDPRGRGGWRGQNWAGNRFKEENRFVGSPMFTRGHDPGRHQRSFTK
ncbi:protein virilizer homolog isoform X2 [Dreissena polymorpha]|uniref:protein virilizer homolog isoform X2 n=1 Tax=Dreissena polymorpha TaxID=45954 RepID=UPI002264AD8E|nr:protein virilizer homolog isoform X2 [Dreissena polymorpha]